MKRLIAGGILVLSLTGCNGNGDDPLPCVDVNLSCSALYTPTFDELHSRTLEPKCALPGGSCHATAGAQAGLVLEDIDTAYDGLSTRVDTADIGCSTVMRRLGSHDDALVMPPGDPLSDPEICVFVQWIDNGATR